MKTLKTLLLIAAVCTLPAAAFAQDTQQPVIYATYYECDPGSEAMADRLMESDLGPLVDRYVSEGKLTTWGWLSHNTGGAWRRAIYFIAPDGGAVLDARTAIIGEIQSKLTAQGQEFNRICPKHEDYIWVSIANSSAPAEVGTNRAAAAMSTYFECDWTREDRADELVKGALGQVLNQHVQNGTIRSWAWNGHMVGGPYRRLLVYDGADQKALLQAVASINREMEARHPAEQKEFNEICNRHQDYMWDVRTPQR